MKERDKTNKKGGKRSREEGVRGKSKGIGEYGEGGEGERASGSRGERLRSCIFQGNPRFFL